MNLVVKLLAAAALAFAACDGRRAGTEVGNPEVAVTAVIAAFDSVGEVDVGSMHFRMLGMNYAQTGYTGPGDSGSCWRRSGGILFEMNEGYASALKDTLVEDVPWGGAEILLRSPEGPAGLPDTAGFEEWSNPRYAKFTVSRGRSELRALFEMPQGMVIRLAYSPLTVAEWRSDGSIWVPILLRSGKWAGFLNPSGAWVRRRDGNGRPYALFSPSENAAAWSELKKRLPEAFQADSVQVR